MKAETTEPSPATISRKEQALLVLLLILAALAFHPLVTGETAADIVPDVVDAFFYASGTSPQFMYILVAGLLLVRHKDIAAAYHDKGDWWSALLFLVPGICLFLWGYFVGARDILHVAFILTGFGSARLLAGKMLTRAILPPVLILVLSTPLPAVLINQLIFPLQLLDTEHSVWLLNTIGIPSLAMGDMISMAGSSARFAESCTALGFIIWLTIFALAYIYIFRITRWHAVLLVLSAPFIAYAVNILRAFSLVLNPALDVLTIHTFQGIVFFLIGFSLLYAVDSMLLRHFGSDRGAHKVESGLPDRHAFASQKPGALYVLVLLFAALLTVSLTLPKWPAPAADANPAISLADELGEWHVSATPAVNYRFLGSVRYSSTLYRDYRRGGKEPVSIFIGTDDRLRRHRSLLSDKNGYQDAIGLAPERATVNLGPGIGDAVAIVSDNGTQRMLTYHWYEGADSIAKEILYALLALDQSPLRREKQLRVTRLATYIAFTPDGRLLADKRLRAFLRETKISRAK